MYNIKSNLILIVLVLLSIPATTQQSISQTEVNQNHAKRPWEFSLFIGKAFAGPSNDISASMAADQSIGIPCSFAFKYNLNQKSGISLSRGRNESATITGEGYGTPVRSILKSTSLDYVHSLGHSRHELSAGISFITLHMKSNNKDDRVSGKDVAKRVGFNIGYSCHIIETKGFFLAFYTQYNWAGTASIGPYSIYEEGYSYDYGEWPIFGDISGFVPSQTSKFPVVYVHLDSFNVGFSVGFRFGEKVAIAAASE